MTDCGGPDGGFAARSTYSQLQLMNPPKRASWNAGSVGKATGVVDRD